MSWKQPFEFDMNQPVEVNRKLFLDDLVKYYSEDTSRRSVEKVERSTFSHCFYRHPEDNRPCAIGRWMSDGEYQYLAKINDVIISVSRAISEFRLLSNIQFLGIPFLMNCQALHDRERYWNESGLTEEGESAMNSIIKDYCS